MPVLLGEKGEILLINASEIEMKPFWKRWLCIHNFTGGMRVVYDNKGKTRIYLFEMWEKRIHRLMEEIVIDSNFIFNTLSKV